METLVIITLGLGIAVIILGTLTAILMRRINRLTGGAGASSLEEIIKENNILAQQLSKSHRALRKDILALQEDSRLNIQNIGVVRFNPFREMGGSQSFALALTDKENNGVVISSLYTRDRVNVFAKPLVAGTSEYTLTKEEQEAINRSHV